MTGNRSQVGAPPAHPLHNDQPLKLGVFCVNVNNGLFVSDIPDAYEPTWDAVLEIARLAEEAEFETVVPIARWLGFGGRTNFHQTSLETLTFAAGVAQATTKISVFATVLVPTLHPVYAAKAVATIDHISRGRIGLNMVMGWSPPEMAEFGVPLLEHSKRYAYGQEWIDVVTRLWESDEPFDVDGEFFQLTGCASDPKPVQNPRPVLLNAGGSPAGQNFSARNVDFNFVNFTDGEKSAAYVRGIKDLAKNEYDREIGVMSMVVVIARDTEEEAKARYQEVYDNIDWEAAQTFSRSLGMNSVGTGGAKSDEVDRAELGRFAAAGGNHLLVGTPEQIADGLAEVHEAGVDCLFLVMLDYSTEIPYFSEKVMPLLKERGVRI